MEIPKNLKDDFKIGGVYEFKIIDIYPGNYGKLINETTGVDTYLRNISNLNLKKNQIIKCRVWAFDSKRPLVELVDAQDYKKEESKITEEALTAILNAEDVGWNVKDFIRGLLSNADDKTFENQCHNWIKQLLNKKHDLSFVRDNIAKLLENSDFLDLCNQQEREFYQDRLTLIIELIEYYHTASELVAQDKTNDNESTAQFIDNLFAKLKTSGYVYQPRKNFNILTCLFLLKPEVMNSRIRELLTIVSLREYATWSREPFNNALFKVLDLFISYNEDRIDKIKDNRSLIDNVLLALHLQLFLMGSNTSSDDIDQRTILARLCMISSYLNNPAANKLINNAFYNLYNSNIKKYAVQKDDYQLSPYKIAQLPTTEIDSRLRYAKKNVRIDVSKDGINLYTDATQAGLRQVFPKELGLWKNLQIYRVERNGAKITPTNINDLTHYQELWVELESEFMTLKQPVAVTAPSRNKRYRVGESVLISFIRQDEKDKDKFYCRIENGRGGEGYIYIKDIINYYVEASLRDFYDAKKGSRYTFNATIKAIEKDMYHFSMIEDIKEMAKAEFLNYDGDIVCSVGSTPNVYGGYQIVPAVTEDGLGISLKINDVDEDVRKYDVVNCRVTGVGQGDFNLNCEMTGFADRDFNVKSAFRTLIYSIYVDMIDDSAENQEPEANDDGILPLEEKYLRETILLIDRMAYIEDDYVKSFNYLGFARILCMLLNWDTQADYYKGRMDIISNLHYFGLNRTIDESKLNQLAEANAELLTANSVLRDRFMQLQIVSYKDKPHYNVELFNTIETDPNHKTLASLVLAYNLSKENNLDRAATDFYNKIINLLKIKGFETGLKSYGEENDHTEFKTSIVFPAGNGITAPNFDVQIKEILRVINSFLNTGGGTLYIGVSDSGLGVGIEEDLKTSYYYGDHDKYLRSIQDAVANAWDNSVLTTYVDVRFDDDDNDKEVVRITVRAHEKGVPYDEDYWVKANGSKRRLSKKEFEKYKRVNRPIA